MKKIVNVLLILIIVLTGCSNKTGGAEEGSTWDYVEYKTIEEINEVAGTNLVSAAIAGKSNEKFGVISKNIAQYTFEANGNKWCLRASKDVDNDISGLYYESIGFEKDTTATYYTDEVYAFRFFNNGVQYVISTNVADTDITMSGFDSICNEFKTNITGVKSGYEIDIYEEGDNIVYKSTMFNDDGTTTIMETIYEFEEDKMVSIISNVIFETEEAAKEYYDMLIEYGKSADEMALDGVKISSCNTDTEFYSDYTKTEFFKSMEDSIAQ